MVPYAHLLDTPAGPVEWFGFEPTESGSKGSFILVHGIQGTASGWQNVATRLSGPRAVLMPNLRGRGRSHSPGSIGAYQVRNFAEDLQAIVSVAPKPITLVAWSMGVLVALTALFHSEVNGLDGLILASGTAHPAGEAVWFYGESIEALEHEARTRAKRLALEEYASPLAVAGAWASVKESDLCPILRTVRLPTLVLHGELDDQCPLKHGEKIAASIPHAQFELWAGAGHNLMAHDPQRFADAVLRLYGALSSNTIVARL